MDSVFGSLALGFSVALQPQVLWFAFLGCVVGTLVGMLPGFNRIKMQLDVDSIDDSFFNHAEAIVLSMTPWERRHPDKIDGKRRKRVLVKIIGE